MKKYDVIIIGAGIAGITCGIYLKKAGKNILILEKSNVGGLLNKCYDITNYPGYINIKGPDLAFNLYNQINDNDIEIKYEEVISIKENEVITNENSYLYEYLVIASGRCERKITNNNLKTISYCGLCDGSLYKNMEVSLVGGGDSAIATSLYLSGICSKVNMIVRKDKLRGDNNLINKIVNKDNINIIYNKSIKEVYEENDNNVIILNDNKKIVSKALFVCIGYDPVSDIYDIDKENDYIVTDSNMKTSKDNIYAIGDIRKKDIYQLTTASYDGTVCSVNIIKRLNERR